MIVRTTQKVRDKIKLAACDAPLDGSDPAPFLHEWYVNLFVQERRTWFIFTESRTLYSVVQNSAGINSRQAFERLATDVLFSVFKYHALSLPVSLFESIADSVSIQKTTDRRIMGSQNDLIHMAGAHGDDFSQINRTPMSYLKSRPDLALAKAIAELQLPS